MEKQKAFSVLTVLAIIFAIVVILYILGGQGYLGSDMEHAICGNLSQCTRLN